MVWVIFNVGLFPWLAVVSFLLLRHGVVNAQETRVKTNGRPDFAASVGVQGTVDPRNSDGERDWYEPCASPPSEPFLAQLRLTLQLQGITTSSQCLAALPTWLTSREGNNAPSLSVASSGTSAPAAYSCATNGFSKLRKRAEKALTCLLDNVLTPMCTPEPSNSDVAQHAANPSHPSKLESRCSNAGLTMKNLQLALEDSYRQCCERTAMKSITNCLSGLQTLSTTVSSALNTLGVNLTSSVGESSNNDTSAVTDSGLACAGSLGAMMRFMRRAEIQVQQLSFMDTLLQLGNSTNQLMNVVQQMTHGNRPRGAAADSLHNSSGESLEMISKSVFFLICDASFPTCVQGSLFTVAPCSAQCYPMQSLLTSLQPFVDVSKIPALDLVRSTSKRCIPSPVTSRHFCSVLHCDSSGTCRVRPMPRGRADLSTSSAGAANGRKNMEEETAATQTRQRGFCLNFDCPFPLRKTAISSHSDQELSRSLMPLHTLLQEAFPGASVPYNTSLLSCGQDCVTVGFTSEQQKIARYILSAGSIGTELFIIVALLAFWLNRDTLANVLVRRLVLYFNISSAVTVSVFVPVAFADVESFVCHTDGTRRLAEPSSSALCVLTEALAHLGISMTGLLFLSFTHAWYELIRSLHQPGISARARQVTGKSPIGNGIRGSPYVMDAMYVGGSLLISLIFVLIVLVRRGIEGSPLFGICLARYDGFFLEFVIAPLAAFLAFGTVFLAIGLYHLAQYRRKDKERQKKRQMETVAATSAMHAAENGKNQTVISWSTSSVPARTKRSTSRARSTSKTRATFSRLIHQMLFYIIVIFINVAAMLFLGAYIGANQATWTDQVSKHVQCQLSSCTTESCPPLPQLSLGFFLAPFVIGFLSSMILCSWAFTWRLWSRFFLGRRDAGKSDGVFTSTKMDPSRIPEGRPDLCRQDTHEVKIPFSPRRLSTTSELEVGTGGSSPPSYSSTSPVSYRTPGRVVKNTAL